MYKKMLGIRSANPDIDNLVKLHGNNPAVILELLQGLQAQNGGLTADDIKQVAVELKIPAERAFGVASFYSMLTIPPSAKPIIRICDGPPCWLRGAGALREAAQEKLSSTWEVERTSCLGLCDRAPAALVGLDPCGPLDIGHLLSIDDGWRGDHPDYSVPLPEETRVLLANIQGIDPRSLSTALEHGAYQGLKKALSYKPNEVIDEVELAKVRGRGGAGFPAGRKWRLVAQSDEVEKYIVCNADESEPLVFKDRVLMETNPHQVLEGMIIAGYAVGAKEGFIYIRGEYEVQAKILEHALEEAKAKKLLGEKIMGSDFTFHIHVHRGAGAYICGEETAMLESLEGRRGEPRVRPPYPTVNGYRGCPTIVNNVETFATIPPVLQNGAEWFLNIGMPESPGTKLYTILGHVNRPGLFEAPFGLTLRQIIETYGGGMPEGSTFGFALTGGAAGTIVPSDLLDLPIKYDSKLHGISLGAGAILVCDQSVQPAALLRELMYFFEVESCGKCTPCRIGTRLVREILDRIVLGDIRETDFAELRALSEVLEVDSFCGLGQFASMPLNTCMKHFKGSFTKGG
jgi:NADH:ubiquinone oxidoreductase subunit F (NADH-binding)/NADH:ubiquinone oxidoreductase subunit E